MNFTRRSQDLMSFFIKHKHLNYNKLTGKTTTILKELYDVMLKANNNTNYAREIKKLSTSNPISKPSSFNSNSFPETIRQHIDKLMVTELTYSFSLYDRKVKVHFFVEEEVAIGKTEMYDRYIQMIYIWLCILNMYSSKECVKTLIAYFYFTSLEKRLPNSNIHILNEKNVNTAFTTTCPKDSEIVVFRKEEWFKVFIHETFHNFGLDFSMMNNEHVNKCILNIFKVHSQVNSYEAYTEFWAEIINAGFCSFKDSNNVNSFLSKMEIYINLERTYSFFQLVKTLDFMGLTYKDLYSNNKHSIIARENLYKENTNVLSYYVIKCVLMNNYQGFFNWCLQNNSSLFNFKKTTKNQKEFCEFIKANYKTQSMLNGIYNAEEFLNKLKYKRKNNVFVLSNLRMSICELG